LNCKSETEPELAGEFDRVFSDQPPEAIAYAFATWREFSQFMPTIADVTTLVRQWHRQKAEVTEGVRRAADKQTTEAAHTRGELADLADLKAELLKLCQFPAAPTDRQMKQKAALDRLRRSGMPPALSLTPAQIAARREREREEIRKAGETA
jgi:hypothetical protein